MKKILIILVLLLLLGGGGGAAWWFYFRTDPNAPPPVPPAPEVTQLFIPIGANDSLTIPVIKDGKVVTHFYLRLTLIFDDPKNRDKVSPILPALTNDFIVELSDLLPRKLVEESHYDPNLIQTQLQKVFDMRVGKGVGKVSITTIEQGEQ
jgi:flagellar FliL protein